MVENFNTYTRKRDCYKDKVIANSTLKSTVSAYFENCMEYSSTIGNYELEANLFGELYERNITRHSQAKLDTIIGEFDAVESHLNAKIQEYQGDINYWHNMIQEYDRREAEENESEE